MNSVLGFMAFETPSCTSLFYASRIRPSDLFQFGINFWNYESF